MISGHRRKAAYRLLAEDDESFARMPCRIVEGVTDEQAITLLHAANYFTRELSVTERAAATRALGEEVERMRRSDPGLSGMRTEDIKAEIISAQTGRKVSGKSIRRQEALASIIENDLSTGWRSLADEGRLSSEAVRMLSKVPRKEQMRLHVRWTEEGGYGKRDTTDFIRRSTSKGTDAAAPGGQGDSEVPLQAPNAPPAGRPGHDRGHRQACRGAGKAPLGVRQGLAAKEGASSIGREPRV